jgi:hypothetical protein
MGRIDLQDTNKSIRIMKIAAEADLNLILKYGIIPSYTFGITFEI